MSPHYPICPLCVDRHGDDRTGSPHLGSISCSLSPAGSDACQSWWAMLRRRLFLETDSISTSPLVQNTENSVIWLFNSFFLGFPQSRIISLLCRLIVCNYHSPITTVETISARWPEIRAKVGQRATLGFQECKVWAPH